jgi:hypothetical protein
MVFMFISGMNISSIFPPPSTDIGGGREAGPASVRRQNVSLELALSKMQLAPGWGGRRRWQPAGPGPGPGGLLPLTVTQAERFGRCHWHSDGAGH